MPVDRFFYDADLRMDEMINLCDAEHHHLAHVTKTKLGEYVEVINGRGLLARARVLQIERRFSSLQIQKIDNELPEKKELILAQAIPRMNRLDTIIEKGTELGVTHFWLFPGESSEREELSVSQIHRLRSVAISAIKQCGRLYLPFIALYPALSDWKKETTLTEALLLFGDLDPKAASVLHIAKDKWNQQCIFLTGPESGLTAKELSYLRLLGGVGISLHKNILRTDTASIVALGLISQMR